MDKRFIVGLLIALLTIPFKLILLLLAVIIVGPVWIRNWINEWDTYEEDEVFASIIFWPFEY